MKKLIIIGARGWGREVLDSFRKLERLNGEEFEIKGFLDDKADAFDGLDGSYPPILSSVESYIPQIDDVFFCALGDPIYRKKYVDIIEAKGGEFVSYICPRANVLPSAKIGKGSFISGDVYISDNVEIGEQTVIHRLCTIGHDVKIGNYVTVEAYCFFGGFSEVGDFSAIHVRSTIISHKKVGQNASVGTGSVVIRNVKDGNHVFGNPAVTIK